MNVKQVFILKEWQLNVILNVYPQKSCLMILFTKF